MNLASLVWISFARNWPRTVFVLIAVIAAFGLFGALETIRYQRDAPPIDGDIVIVTGEGTTLPRTYEAEILGLDTVRAATGLMGAPVENPQSASQPIIIGATNSAKLADTLPGMHISRELTERWLGARIGAICDERTAREHGWRVNDHLTFALMGGMRTQSGSNQVELVLVGTYSNGSLLSGLLTHSDYFLELFPHGPNPFGNFFVRPRDSGRASDLALQIDELFKTRAETTRSAPISDYRQQSMKSATTVRMIIRGTLAVSFFTMVLIVANALAQSVRERLGEMALLHALGFQGRTVLLLVVAESIALLAIGAAAGLALAAGAFGLHIVNAPSGSWQLPIHTILYGAVFVLGSALIAALLPCWELARLPVADALRRL